MSVADSADSLEKIATEVATCQKCPLHQGRTNTVPGEGRPDAAIMFVGEGPGFHEDRQGKPFVGASGNFLESMLNGIGLQREDVFIANVVKCRPPGNRDPQSDEIEACSEYLDRQIALIDPKVIVTLAGFIASHRRRGFQETAGVDRGDGRSPWRRGVAP
jgi:DNA polymerase